MATFPVTTSIYDTTKPSIQCQVGPLSGSTTLQTLYIRKAKYSNDPTHGSINKDAGSAVIVASWVEFTAVWNAANNPLTLILTLDDELARITNCSHIVPAPALAPHMVLQSIQQETVAISTTTTAIHQRLTIDLQASVQHLDKLTHLVRIGLLKLGVPPSELPAGALVAPGYERPSEPPPSSDGPSAPEYLSDGKTFENLVPPGRH